MEEKLKDDVSTLASILGKATGQEMSTIGRKCAADTRFFSRLDDGHSFTVRKYDKVVNWFSQNWPDSADWPDSVERPKKTKPESA